MNPEYPHIYAPVLRSPLLFHHHTGLSTPTYNPAQPRGTHSTTNLYLPHPASLYQPQFLNTVQTPLPNNSQSYPYYSTLPKAMVSPLVPFFSYPTPTISYAATVSSKGLTLILIATLILVALDLVMVRPQKR